MNLIETSNASASGSLTKHTTSPSHHINPLFTHPSKNSSEEIDPGDTDALLNFLSSTDEDIQELADSSSDKTPLRSNKMFPNNGGGNNNNTQGSNNEGNFNFFNLQQNISNQNQFGTDYATSTASNNANANQQQGALSSSYFQALSAPNHEQHNMASNASSMLMPSSQSLSLVQTAHLNNTYPNQHHDASSTSLLRASNTGTVPNSNLFINPASSTSATQPSMTVAGFTLHHNNDTNHRTADTSMPSNNSTNLTLPGGGIVRNSAASMMINSQQRNTNTPSTDNPFGGIPVYHDNDVLCGRGGKAYKNLGNFFFRQLVHTNKVLYLTSSREKKAHISQSIVATIRSQNPSGRFLERNPLTGLWYDIGDKRSIEKTSQALREGAPRFRQTMMAKMKAEKKKVEEERKKNPELGKEIDTASSAKMNADMIKNMPLKDQDENEGKKDDGAMDDDIQDASFFAQEENKRKKIDEMPPFILTMENVRGKKDSSHLKQAKPSAEETGLASLLLKRSDSDGQDQQQLLQQNSKLASHLQQQEQMQQQQQEFLRQLFEHPQQASKMGLSQSGMVTNLQQLQQQEQQQQVPHIAGAEPSENNMLQQQQSQQQSAQQQVQQQMQLQVRPSGSATGNQSSHASSLSKSNASSSGIDIGELQNLNQNELISKILDLHQQNSNLTHQMSQMEMNHRREINELNRRHALVLQMQGNLFLEPTPIPEKEAFAVAVAAAKDSGEGSNHHEAHGFREQHQDVISTRSPQSDSINNEGGNFDSAPSFMHRQHSFFTNSNNQEQQQQQQQQHQHQHQQTSQQDPTSHFTHSNQRDALESTLPDKEF